MVNLLTAVLVILALLCPGLFRSETVEVFPAALETAPGGTAVSFVSPEEIHSVLEDCTGYAGTAGSSLKEAIAACKVVSFAEEHRLADIPLDELTEAFSIALNKLDEMRLEELPTNLKSISALVEAARADWSSVAGLFESAGIEEEAAALMSSNEAYHHFLAFAGELARLIPLQP